MLYVTGDTHGDIERFKTKIVKSLKKTDTLIVCGDFGFLWDSSFGEQKILKLLTKRRYKILFVEGTHDNLDMLESYPPVDFCGGKARHIGGNMYHLMRGEIFEIEGKKLFVMGGGESADLDIRQPGVTWWERERPTPKEMADAKENLLVHQNTVDYIITHEASRTMRSFLDMDTDVEHFTVLNDYFNELEKEIKFKQWFFGCYHTDKKIPPRHRALFKDVVALD